MAVFRNNKSKPDSAPAIHSLLGKDVMLTGEIQTGSQSLRIEGSVEGIIHSTGEISIAPGGLVKGTIYAKHLVVTGRAEGTMKITECLEIHGTGYVEGDVEVGSLVVDEGGTLQGVCVRRDQTRNVDTIGTAKGGTLALSHSGQKPIDTLDTKF
ncbi:bactofilin family protein [Geothrix fuzhouensis]|uniref:bactofilin family protein n=1 Tax=Geothrix fuzhouensis TaxID=2966451 RepID=UPI0021495BD2|nr:polymer-forming cytoskeletal protein [Geothrix fuzhouensis]